MMSSEPKFRRQKGAKKNKDMKKIGHKQLEKIISDLYQFMGTHNLKHVVSKQMLKIPSSNTFYQLFTQMYKMLYENHDENDTFTSEQTQNFFKKLGYEGQTPEDLLDNLSKPNYWSIVLDMLNWFGKLIMAFEDQKESELMSMDVINENDVYSERKEKASFRDQQIQQFVADFHQDEDRKDKLKALEEYLPFVNE